MKSVISKEFGHRTECWKILSEVRLTGLTLGKLPRSKTAGLKYVFNHFEYLTNQFRSLFICLSRVHNLAKITDWEG